MINLYTLERLNELALVERARYDAHRRPRVECTPAPGLPRGLRQLLLLLLPA